MMSRASLFQVSFFSMHSGERIGHTLPGYQIIVCTNGWPIVERSSLRLNMSDRNVMMTLQLLGAPQELEVQIEHRANYQLMDILRYARMISFDYVTNLINATASCDILADFSYTQRWVNTNGRETRLPFSEAVGNPNFTPKPCDWSRDGF